MSPSGGHDDRWHDGRRYGDGWHAQGAHGQRTRSPRAGSMRGSCAMHFAATSAAGGTVAERYDPSRTSRANMKSCTETRLARMRRNWRWQKARMRDRLRVSKRVVRQCCRTLVTAGQESRRTLSMPFVSSTARGCVTSSSMLPTYRFLVCRMQPMYTCRNSVRWQRTRHMAAFSGPDPTRLHVTRTAPLLIARNVGPLRPANGPGWIWTARVRRG